MTPALTPPSSATAADLLAPVREALLARARAEAARVVAQADADVAARVEQASREADDIRAAARAQGAADARRVLAAERARARAEARAGVLAAQQQVYQQLRRQVHEDVARLRLSPDYPAARRRLAARARALLGEAADVREDPDGGVVAELGGRRVVASLPALADEALDAVVSTDPDLERLWSA